ncbi:MAG: SAM-dependent methyltransferase [uncultured Candidatus Poseidoniales archaeon]|jgi:FkbM family methyltransferase|nr:MAG: SAM-dependent methyltransferase [uncultured Candidatus Poseidoniales archaeon]
MGPEPSSRVDRLIKGGFVVGMLRSVGVIDMLKALFWRINFFLKNRKSAKINRQLGNGVISVIVESKNGVLAVDPRDLEVGYKLRTHGSYGFDEITRINQFITSKSNVLVVGAHIGSLVIPIAKNCNKVVAIEANPNNFDLLKTNLHLNKSENVTIHNIAASSQQETIKFQMNVVNSGGSKRLPKNNEYMYRYDHPEVIEIQAHALDDYLDENNFDLVLIDIEGSEYFAMQGMEKILSNCTTLIIEFLPHHLKNVADVSVEQFLSLVPNHFTKLTIPSKNETHPIDVGGVMLKQMYANKEGDDGIIFSK